MAKNYPKEVREEAVGLYLRGQSAREVCAKFGMSRSTLLLWAKENRPDGNGQIPREIYLLKKEAARLRVENQIFRDCGCSPASPLGVRLEAISRLSKTYSIHALCDLLQVNRSAYYHHALRAPDQTQLQMEDDTLKPLIQNIFEKSGGRFGARKIRVKLIEEGHRVSERRIYRLMKELCLSSEGTKPKLNSANDRQYQYYPNKLKRNFLTDSPNRVWVSDITYAKVGMDFLYLCVVIDLYSRKVIAHKISDSIDTKLVKDTFQNAYESRRYPENLIFHSDQGTQYTAFEFVHYLRTLGVKQSFSAPGCPHDNAVAESFFASIKKEDFRRNFYQTESDFLKAVDAYVDFYNDYRPHQRLGMLTPNQVEAQFYESVDHR